MDTFGSRFTRRARTVPAVLLAAIVSTLAAPLWMPVAALADLARARRRLPLLRLGAFAVGWTWLEVIGVGRATGLWLTRRGRDLEAHYRLQQWWVTTLMRVLRTTTGMRVLASGAEALRPGPTIVLARHASLIDSLVSAWIVTTQARMQPHYVLKRELLNVPNLDVVGNRLPNVFVDRSARGTAADEEITRIEAAARRLGPGDAIVIFPEGTRANAHKRARALGKIAESDPERAARLGTLTRLLPPRPAGTLALLRGAPTATVVTCWHTGLDGWDTFAGIVRHLALPPPVVTFTLSPVQRPADPSAAWLDDCWLDLDRAVGHADTERNPR